MKVVIHPSGLDGMLNAPVSKSYMQRACLAALLRGGLTEIQAGSHSADDAVMIRFLKEAGCNVQETDVIIINAADADLTRIRQFDFSDSGLAARMCIPVLALSDDAVDVSGSAQLSRRPMSFFETVLPALGVKIKSSDGHFPMTLKGALRPASVLVDGSTSSQFITGLLMAYSAALASDVTISVQHSVSTSYIDITLEVLREFGLKSPVRTASGAYYFSDELPKKNGQKLSYIVPGDWSSAAFLAVAGAIAGDVTITGLDVFSSQGDKAVLQALMDAGAALSIMPDSIRARRASLNAFHFNATDTPDLFPPLAALALYAGGTSVIEGISRLRGKESDRANTICEELAKMGAVIRLQDDLMIIEGGKPLSGAAFSAHGDHRIAMMCAVATLGASSSSTIEDAAAVIKSYPGFWKDLQSLGATITTA